MLARPLVFVGLPGAGKSTVGRAVAERLGCAFLDLDRLLEVRSGLSMPQLFAEQGVDAFRQMERELTDELLAAPPAVWAPGGGWVTAPGVLARVRDKVSMIHLGVSPAAALARLRQDASIRPLLAGADPEGVLDRLFRERSPLYAVADLTLDTEVLDFQQVVDLACAFAQAEARSRIRT
jgi:shikimate kinase